MSNQQQCLLFIIFAHKCKELEAEVKWQLIVSSALEAKALGAL